jgi:hypothetical protein
MPAFLFPPLSLEGLRKRAAPADLVEDPLVLGISAAILTVTLTEIILFVNFLSTPFILVNFLLSN